MKEKIRQITNSINRIFNFFLLLPVYFVGLGLSKILYKFFASKENNFGWKNPEKLKRDIKNYEDMI